MGNINSTPEKVELRQRLFNTAIRTLEREEWKVERVPGIGKSSVRRIKKGGKSLLATIRTSQDTWIAFPWDKKNEKWGTLADVDVVVAVSVDDAKTPRFAQVHMFDADEMRDRFDRNYAARTTAGHSLLKGATGQHGVWLSLYHEESKTPVNRVGAGAGLKYPPIARVPLANGSVTEPVRSAKPDTRHALTVQEAKEGVALGLGVDPSCVKITIEV